CGGCGGLRREKALPEQKDDRHEREPGDERDRDADGEVLRVEHGHPAAKPRRPEVDRVTALRHLMGTDTEWPDISTRCRTGSKSPPGYGEQDRRAGFSLEKTAAT